MNPKTTMRKPFYYWLIVIAIITVTCSSSLCQSSNTVKKVVAKQPKPVNATTKTLIRNTLFKKYYSKLFKGSCLNLLVRYTKIGFPTVKDFD